MPLRAGGRACINCGDPVTGASDVCADCTPDAPARIGTATCPYCAKECPWEGIGRYLRTHSEGRVEALYFCPACRGILEAACWMER